MVDEAQRQVVVAHVGDAVANGAAVRTGGTVPDEVGYWYPPTVLTDVTDDMLIMSEETFGPVAPVQVVDDFAEAVRKAGQGAYGLAATVYTTDPEHVTQAGATIPAGVMWINKWQGPGSEIVAEPARHSGMSPIGHHAAYDAATRPSSVIGTAGRQPR